MSDPAPRKTLTFSAAQNRLITSSITLFCGAAILTGIVFAVILLLKGLSYFQHILGPVIVAFFLSLLTRPWYGKLRSWFGERDLPAVIAFSLSFLIPIVLLCWFFGAFLIEQGLNLCHALPHAMEQVRDTLLTKLPDAKELILEIFPNISDFKDAEGALSLSKLMEVAGKGIHVGGAVFAAGSAGLLWLLTFFYWIIFVMQRPLTGDQFADLLPFLSTAKRLTVARHFQNFTAIIVSYFRGQILDVIIQGFLYGLAFQIMQLPNGFIIGFVLGLLNLVPYLGVTIGLCMALPVAYSYAGLHYTLAIFAVFCCIQTFDGYVMQPHIQSKRMKLSAWQIVFALLFWTQIGGFLGLLLAIPLTAFVKASWSEWRKMSDEFVESEESLPPETGDTGEAQ